MSFDPGSEPTLNIPHDMASERKRELAKGKPAFGGGGIAYLWAGLFVVVLFFLTNQALTAALYSRAEQLMRAVLFGSSADRDHPGAYRALGTAPFPAWLAQEREIDQALRDIEVNKCNSQAVRSLVDHIVPEGFRKQAAAILEATSFACPNASGLLYKAADLWTGLGEHDRAVGALTTLSNQYPQNQQFRYARGQNYLAMSRFREALSDLAATVSMTDEKQSISSNVFVDMAEAYAGLGKHCEAVTALQSFALLDPRSNDTSRLRALVERYVKAGQCDREYASGEQRLPQNLSGTNIVLVSLNGVQGRFVLDTGASFVSITADFARRANLVVGDGPSIQVQTANGAVEAAIAAARSVQVGRASARNVSVLVQRQSFGPGVDGLLGMSFLSRFDLQLSSGEIVLRPRILAQSR